ncbi:hypothetical protein C1646_660811 [Rhizophagus diaphanus]|nr:hypothetical protein C1646_660811 [Rhizophagus diaphanus] [Rhizophagus sp. MUCL 43196]
MDDDDIISVDSGSKDSADDNILSSNCVRAKNCTGDYTEGSLCDDCNHLKVNSNLASRIYIKKPSEKNLKFIPNEKGLNETFKDSEVFLGLCEIMCQVSKRKEENKTTNNLRYSVLLPRFPSIIIALISNNGADSANTIVNFHNELLEISSQLNFNIFLISSDSAAAEF